jgi:N-acetylglucosaminyldiphosphoundecaprenol N-acetyl-beta-D-mannosaminyltransferase
MPSTLKRSPGASFHVSSPTHARPDAAHVENGLGAPIAWPMKRDLFGVQITAAGHDEVCDAIMATAQRRMSAAVSAFAVHALIEAATSRELGDKVNRFAAITPDGQPVRWALRWLYGDRLNSTVQGYELMQRLCERAAASGVSIYLYGSAEGTLAALKMNLEDAFPSLKIAGIESPPFRPLTAEEDTTMVERINASGAGIVFVGLGCPKQDHFAADHLDRIHADATLGYGLGLSTAARAATPLEAIPGDELDLLVESRRATIPHPCASGTTRLKAL